LSNTSYFEVDVGVFPEELSGMTDEGIVEQVLVYRPLLPLEKEVIYDYAHKYGG